MSARLPLGFQSDQLRQLQADLRDVLPDGTAFLTGSACSFLSPSPLQRPGHTFDARGRGTTDLEIELVAPHVARALERRQAPCDERIFDIVDDRYAVFRRFANLAGGRGFYDAYPEVLGVARDWGRRLGRPHGVHVHLLTASTRPHQLGELGGPIELCRVTRAAPRPPRTNVSAVRHTVVRSFRAPFANCEALARHLGEWTLRDSDYYGPYLLVARAEHVLRLHFFGQTWTLAGEATLGATDQLAEHASSLLQLVDASDVRDSSPF